LKWQAVWVGRPEHVKSTVPLKPLSGVTVTLMGEAVPPLGTSQAFGKTFTEGSGVLSAGASFTTYASAAPPPKVACNGDDVGNPSEDVVRPVKYTAPEGPTATLPKRSAVGAHVCVTQNALDHQIRRA
jgi:hypothetical protein